MEPALDVLNRSLHGDEGARSFLDRTSSIYVLDMTDMTKPKTYGCWNFIHQAINEVERAEAVGSGLQLTPHVQLLATMALRVARRSNALDKHLVGTCIENAAKYHGSASDAERLIEINVEIRDIVMGRIAALALDPSFHRHASSSAFSDPVVMETFCAVLAANAVSNGPNALKHLVSEWIVPSSSNLPPFCLGCVPLHLALEASRKTAPIFTQDTLQRLSTTVMAGVLAPVLSDAIKETNNSDSERQAGVSMHDFNCRIAALSMRAINQWCSVTDLSLAQIKHICSKVQINIVEVLSDAMYSDSGLVLDALADLVEAIVQRHQVPSVSEERMTQTRYIMQVDEEAFRSSISPDQLVTIESKEMMGILEEFVSAIGLQRFRFIDRQNNGDHNVCRNLARIAASVCQACSKLTSEGNQLRLGPGLLDMLIKVASHPSVNVCALSLEVLAPLAATEVGLAHELLPLLQRRAITPHHFTDRKPQLSTSDVSEVNFHEFDIFRECVLVDSLLACWKTSHQNYMASCTAAIEEFCSENSSTEVSFHLEAALFCVGAIADEALASNESGLACSPYLKRCTSALAGKPESLTSNPLTLSQACRFLRRFDKWYNCNEADGVLTIAADLALSTFAVCATDFPLDIVSVEMKREAGISPYTEAAQALKALLCHYPQQFLSNQAISALGAGWEASYAAANRPGVISVDDRKCLCIGVCHVLASLPDSQRAKSLMALAMPSLDCLETMTESASRAQQPEQREVILARISSEIVMVTTIVRSFTDAFSTNDSNSGCRTSDGHAAIVEQALPVVKRAWPSIGRVAAHYSYNATISSALGYFLIQCLPPEFKDGHSVSLLKELCLVATSIIESDSTGSTTTLHFQPVFDFLRTFVKIHGDTIDKDARSAIDGRVSSNGGRGREVGQCFESLLLATVAATNSLLGATWSSTQRQGNGQPAFESKVEAVNERKQTSDLALASMFALLRTCAERCPVFLLHLPAAPGLDRNEDLLLRRGVESAAASLVESDASTSGGAVAFLEAMVTLTQSSSEDVRHIAEEILSRVRQNVISAIIVGSCGKLDVEILQYAASLLRSLILASSTPEETQTTLAQSLGNDNFLLGNEGRVTVSTFLLKPGIPNEQVSEFLKRVWELHQVESPEPLEGSDALARFCKLYAI